MPNLPHDLYRRWVHSHEEDVGDIQVYRPEDYPFPPARGRTGFEIQENGDFIQDAIAPTDGTRTVHGHWQAAGPNAVEVEFDDNRRRPLRLDIVSVSPELLRARLTWA